MLATSPFPYMFLLLFATLSMRNVLFERLKKIPFRICLWSLVACVLSLLTNYYQVLLSYCKDSVVEIISIQNCTTTKQPDYLLWIIPMGEKDTTVCRTSRFYAFMVLLGLCTLVILLYYCYRESKSSTGKKFQKMYFRKYWCKQANTTSLNTEVEDNGANATSYSTDLDDNDVYTTSYNTKVDDNEVNTTSYNTKVDDIEINTTSYNTEGDNNGGNATRYSTDLEDNDVNTTSFNTDMNNNEVNPISYNTEVHDNEVQLITAVTNQHQSATQHTNQSQGHTAHEATPEWQNIDVYLKERGRKRVEVSKQGHCLLNAFAESLKREKIEDVPPGKLNDQLACEIYENYEIYAMRLNTEYDNVFQDGANSERFKLDVTANILLTALCNLQQVCAKVYVSRYNGIAELTVNPSRPGLMPKGYVYMSLDGGDLESHYNAVVPMEESEITLKDGNHQLRNMNRQPKKALVNLGRLLGWGL